jgi:hypothetical protein
MPKRLKTLTGEQLDRLAARLNGADALDPRGGEEDFTWNCDNELTHTRRILGDMGLTWEQIEAATEELEDLGGHCDCEVMFNVVCVDGEDGQ